MIKFRVRAVRRNGPHNERRAEADEDCALHGEMSDSPAGACNGEENTGRDRRPDQTAHYE